MAKLYNLARMTTATTGTGAITLGSAVSGYLTFALAGVADGDVLSYAIKDGTSSEIGTGTYTASGTTLSRTVTKSTNSNAAITLSGTAEVFVTARAEDFLDPTYLPGVISGLTLSNNAADATNDIDITAGSATSEDQTRFMKLASGLTKQLDATWSAGTNAGGRFTASISDTTWHVFLISNGTTTDVGFSSSVVPTGDANYPSGYAYRRIGSIIRASSAILGFIQDGNWFQHKLMVVDQSGAANPGASAVLRNVTVPSGIRVLAKLHVALTAADYLLVTDPSTTDELPLAGTSMQFSTAGISEGYDVMTSTSAQVRTRLNSGTAVTLRMATRGWFDARGTGIYGVGGGGGGGGGVAGSTGATDNRLLRADGVGGATVQNSAVTLDDSGNMTGVGNLSSVSGVINGTLSGVSGVASTSNTLELQNSTDTGFGVYRSGTAGTTNECYIAYFAKDVGGTSRKTMSISELMLDTAVNTRYSVVRINSNYSNAGTSTDYLGIRIFGGKGTTINGLGDTDHPSQYTGSQDQFMVRAGQLSIMTGTGSNVHHRFLNNSSTVGSGVSVGNITSSGSATAFNTSSDAQLKNDKGIMSADQARKIMSLIAIHSFTWKIDGSKADGVFAQELYKVYPQAVQVGKGKPGAKGFEPWSVDYSKLVPVMLRAQQDVTARLEKLETAAASK